MRFHIDDTFDTYFEVFTGSLYHSTLVLHPLSKATDTTAHQVQIKELVNLLYPMTR